MLRVLLIDDEPVVTRFLAELLEGKGYEVRVVNRPREALLVAHEFNPDAVIVDFQMPEVHGGDIAWQFTTDPVLRHVPLMIVTGYAERVRQFQLPPREIPILEKPLNARTLLSWLQECGLKRAATGA